MITLRCIKATLAGDLILWIASRWWQAQYQEETRKVSAEIRQELRNGNITLNKNHTPWAKK